MNEVNNIQIRIMFKRLLSLFCEIFIFGVSIFTGLRRGLGEFTVGTFADYFTLIYFFTNILILFVSKDRFIGDVFPRIKLVPLGTRKFFVSNVLRIMFHSVIYYFAFFMFGYGFMYELIMAFFANALLGGVYLKSPDKNSLITLTDKLFGSYYIEEEPIKYSQEC